VRLPESNRALKAFVKTLKQDYVKVSNLADAEMTMRRSSGCV
jgi:hypothetical protein